MTPTAPLTGPGAQRAAAREITRLMGRTEVSSRRGLGAPLRVGFLDDGAGGHPMATLMSSRSGSGGGRGGRTRLALLLSLIWVASGKDHSTTRPASFWARLLDLPDPQEAGARAINSTWAELEIRGFVTISRPPQSGGVPTITLLDESKPGTGTPYRIPRGGPDDYYFRVPEGLWTSGTLCDELTGAGLAMYLVTLRTYEFAHTKDSLTFPAATFKERYGLSESTRKKGLRNLEELACLDINPATADDDGGVGHRLRRRNTYAIAAPHLLPPAHQPRSAPHPISGGG